MQMMSAICSAILSVVMLQAALLILMKEYELKFVRYKQLICSKSVTAVSVGTVIVVLSLHLAKWEKYSTPEMVLNVILLWALAVLSVIDHKKQVIPNKILIALLILWIVVIGTTVLADIESGFYLIAQYVPGGAVSSVVFLLCYFLSKRQLGAGDVKLAILMGLYLGSQRALNAFLYGTVVCCIYSLVQVARKKLGWKDGVPLVPFLTLGTWIILLIS